MRTAPLVNVSKSRSAGCEESRCSTTDQDLDDLFAAIDKEIQLDPDVAMDLLDVLKDDAEEEDESGQEVSSIKSSLYLPQDDYEMEASHTVYARILR